MAKKKRVRPSGKWFGVMTVMLIVIVILIGFYFVLSNKANQKNVEVDTRAMHSRQENIPGGQGTENYNKKLEEMNQKKADEAFESGKSHMSTVVGENKNKLNELEASPEKESSQKQNRQVVSKPKTRKIDIDQNPTQTRQQYNRTQEIRRRQIETEQEKISKLSSAYNSQIQNILAEMDSNLQAAQVTVYGDQDLGVNQQTQGQTSAQNNANQQPVNRAQSKLGLAPGDVLYARSDIQINSDVPGPAQATVVSGDLKGSKLLGGFKRHEKHLIVQFSRLITPDGQEHSIKSYAIDPATPKSAVRSSVDNHNLSRWGGLVAASFLSGFGEAVGQSGGTVTTTDGQRDVFYPEMDLNEQLWSAAGRVGDTAARQFERNFDRNPTVYLDANTPIGILVMSVKN